MHSTTPRPIPAVPLIETLEGRTLLSAAPTAAPRAAAATPTSTTTLKVSTASAVLGQSVKVSVSVKARHGKLAGNVELLDNGAPLVAAGNPLTLTLKHGKASYVLGSGDAALFTGSHSLSAEFVSTNTVPTSTSAALPVTVTAPTFTTQTDGLGIATIRKGHGKAVKSGQSVAVVYTGLLASDGTIFDYATANHGAGAAPFLTFQTGANQVITGFDEGTVGMKKGETRVLEIPSALGYGANGAGTAIPPNADLFFIVTLLKAK